MVMDTSHIHFSLVKLKNVTIVTLLVQEDAQDALVIDLLLVKDAKEKAR